jgi:hypothetical protein
MEDCDKQPSQEMQKRAEMYRNRAARLNHDLELLLSEEFSDRKKVVDRSLKWKIDHVMITLENRVPDPKRQQPYIFQQVEINYLQEFFAQLEVRRTKSNNEGGRVYEESLKKLLTGEEKTFFMNQLETLRHKIQVNKEKIDHARSNDDDALQLVSIN